MTQADSMGELITQDEIKGLGKRLDNEVNLRTVTQADVAEMLHYLDSSDQLRARYEQVFGGLDETTADYLAHSMQEIWRMRAAGRMIAGTDKDLLGRVEEMAQVVSETSRTILEEKDKPWALAATTGLLDLVLIDGRKEREQKATIVGEAAGDYVRTFNHAGDVLSDAKDRVSSSAKPTVHNYLASRYEATYFLSGEKRVLDNNLFALLDRPAKSA